MGKKDSIRADAQVSAAMMVGTWLSYSETFIYDQVQHAQRLSYQVLARAKSPDQTRFQYEHLKALNLVERIMYFHFGFAPKIREWLRDCQLVHAHFGLNGAIVTPFAEQLNLPLAVTWHGHDVGGLLTHNRNTIRYRRLHQLAEQLFAYAKIHLCCSEELKTMLISLGAPPDRTIVHRLGINIQYFSPKGPRAKVPTILFVGRLVEKKGLDDALKAFAVVKKHIKNSVFRIVGQGPKYQYLKSLATQLNIEDSIVFLGALPPSDVRDEMRSANVLIAPSYETAEGDRESGILVLKEAGACGTPVIGTKHGGIPEIIVDHKTGFLIEERDIEALAYQICTLLGDDTLQKKFSLSARAFIEREYDTVVQNQKLESHLLSIL